MLAAAFYWRVRCQRAPAPALGNCDDLSRFMGRESEKYLTYRCDEAVTVIYSSRRSGNDIAKVPSMQTLSLFDSCPGNERNQAPDRGKLVAEK